MATTRTPRHTKPTTHTDGSRGWIGNSPTTDGRTVRVTTAHIPAPRTR